MITNGIANRIKGYGQVIPEVDSPKVDQSKGGGSKSFSDVLVDAIKEVDGLQTEADKQIEGVTLKKDGYTTHGAMLALEQADTAFQLMNNIRAKIVRAYEDVLRTQV